jgi:hypothetical protein
VEPHAYTASSAFAVKGSEDKFTSVRGVAGEPLELCSSFVQISYSLVDVCYTAKVPIPCRDAKLYNVLVIPNSLESNPYVHTVVFVSGSSAPQRFLLVGNLVRQSDGQCSYHKIQKAMVGFGA